MFDMFTITNKPDFFVGQQVLIVKGYRPGKIISQEGDLYWVELPRENMKMIFSTGEMAVLLDFDLLPDAPQLGENNGAA
jgi:hypothetical protein